MSRVRFHLQPTASFPDGAPQREEYDNDGAHDRACDKYADEWRAAYECVGCDDEGTSRHRFDCPERGRPAPPRPPRSHR